ncbi:plasmid mobilization protein [Pectinatus frisingensis]|uniref:plasmid mobilization protein n=1 Tax=Pectinatus frisingensis TaxID=865 RepID=UPI003D802265
MGKVSSRISDSLDNNITNSAKKYGISRSEYVRRCLMANKDGTILIPKITANKMKFYCNIIEKLENISENLKELNKNYSEINRNISILLMENKK